jgi:hypothetical protein
VGTTGSATEPPGAPYVVNYVAFLATPTAVNVAENGVQLARISSPQRGASDALHCSSGSWPDALGSTTNAVVLLGLNGMTTSASVGAWASSFDSAQ